MAGFQNDQQRKAVMSQLNPSTGVMSSMIGAPISSSMVTTPGKQSNGIKTYVDGVFDRYKEGKKIGKANEAAQAKKKHDDKQAMELKKRQIETLKDQIKLLQSGKLTDHERDNVLGNILAKDRGLLPKEIEAKLVEQRDALKKSRAIR